MTRAILRLRCGARLLDINAGRYAIGTNFVPPGLVSEALLAAGTAANRYGGSQKVSEKAMDREWGFSVRVADSKPDIGRGASDLVDFLELAGWDAANPLYVEYRPNDDVSVEPIWGQFGVCLRYEVIHVSRVALWDKYGLPTTKEQAAMVNVTMRVKPFAFGQNQKLTNAMGGIWEDMIGTESGRSRGLGVLEATTNKLTNPVFGATTWNSGWTAAANIVASNNTTDREYILFGRSSARLTCRGSSSRTFTMSIAAGNTNTHFISAYVRKPNGGAISPGEFNVYYDGIAYPTNVTHLGNGWYLLGQSVTGVVGATTVGLEVMADRIVHLAGMQFEEKGYSTTLCYGDLLGCTWSGTAHGSSSSRTAGRVRLALGDDNFNLARGSMRGVWRTPFHAITSTVTIFDTGGYALTYIGGSNVFRFTDGTNIIQSGVVTLPQDGTSPIVLHCTWSENGIVLAVNGVVATNGSITLPVVPTWLYVGSDSGVAAHCGGTVMGLDIYDHVMTTAEIGADYTSVVQLSSALDCVSTVPWLWTRDGDGVVDNEETASKDSFCVCGGIPGNAPAVTWLNVNPGVLRATSGRAMFLSLMDLDLNDAVDVATDLYAGASGPTAIGTTTTQIGSVTPNRDDVYYGRESLRVTVLTDAGSGLKAGQRQFYGSNLSASSELVGIAADGTARVFVSAGLVTPEFALSRVGKTTAALPSANSHVLVARSSGSANVSIINTRVMFRPMLKVEVAADANPAVVDIQGQDVLVESGGFIHSIPLVAGDVIELLPDRTNFLFSLIGNVGSPYDSTLTLTYNTVEVTPRWALL